MAAIKSPKLLSCVRNEPFHHSDRQRSLLERALTGGKMEIIFQLLENSVVGFLMAAFGILAIVTVGLWWPITAFLEAWWWGGLTFLFPPTFLVFACLHFKKARKPLILGLLFTIVSVSLFIVRMFLTTFFVQTS